MAQADGLDAGAAQHRAGEHRHGVGVVQKQRVGADLFHVARKVEHHGDGAQRAEDAADAQGIGDGLSQAVFFRHFKVDDGAGIVEPHLNGVDDVIRAAQRVLAVLHAQVCFDAHLVSVVAVDVFQHHPGILQALRIDVVKRNGALGQRGGHHGIAQHVLGKHRAARPHKGNLRHFSVPPVKRYFVVVLLISG